MKIRVPLCVKKKWQEVAHDDNNNNNRCEATVHTPFHKLQGGYSTYVFVGRTQKSSGQGRRHSQPNPQSDTLWNGEKTLKTKKKFPMSKKWYIFASYFNNVQRSPIIAQRHYERGFCTHKREINLFIKITNNNEKNINGSHFCSVRNLCFCTDGYSSHEG